MKCYCIKKVNEKLKENLGQYAHLATTVTVDEKTKEIQPVVTVMAHYLKNKKDGTLRQRKSVAWISAEYCPFCGVKLREDQQ